MYRSTFSTFVEASLPRYGVVNLFFVFGRSALLCLRRERRLRVYSAQPRLWVLTALRPGRLSRIVASGPSCPEQCGWVSIHWQRLFSSIRNRTAQSSQGFFGLQSLWVSSFCDPQSHPFSWWLLDNFVSLYRNMTSAGASGRAIARSSVFASGCQCLKNQYGRK